MKAIRKTCASSRPDLPVQRIDALAVVDAASANWSPGSLLVERRGRHFRILAIGVPADVDRHPASAGAGRTSLPDSILIPGLVNAHTHLDLTHLGPRPFRFEEGFVPWVDMVRTGRHAEDAQIAESVRLGIALCMAGGTVAVGDIAGAPRGRATLAPFQALAESGLAGVSFLEFFGIGRGVEATQSRLEALLAKADGSPSGAVRIGLQPHAPNTVGLPFYRWAAASAARGFPLSTHLAETPEEREFIRSATGPQRELLERFGLWEDSILEHIGHGHHPVAHLADVLASARFTVAHVNDADDAAIEILARTGATIAYCPRASAYFGAERHFGPHRYRDMLAAGIPVALGTDSIVNLPPEAADPAKGGMSILDEMRFLFARDRTDARTLLRMGTLAGADALGLDRSGFIFEPGNSLLGVVAVSAGKGTTPLDRALSSSKPPRLLFPEN
jgi:cytosine/adenosine deaminase-related metal-dependent hydrolase